MTSAKPFKTIDEQLQILKDRKLIINNDEFTKRYLLSNNYYNIINGYSKFFPQNGDDYINGTTFYEVARLYSFDNQMKEIFFKAILAAESHIKSIFAYRFAEEYRDAPYTYLNISCYDPNKTLNVISTIAKLAGVVNEGRRAPAGSIRHYVDAYNDVPIWVLINKLDFGALRHTLTNSTPKVQNNVSRDLANFAKRNIPNVTIFPPEIMLDFMVNINQIRNICAHNNRLLDFRCNRDMKYWNPLHSHYGIASTDHRRYAYDVFLALQCYLTSIENRAFHNSVLYCMQKTAKSIKSVQANDIFKTLGFPDNWYSQTSKK